MTSLSVADARAALSRHIESAATTHERFDITRNGVRLAVLMGADDYDALVETLDVLGDGDRVEVLTTALAELDAGDVSTTEEVRQSMIDRGRLGG